MKSCYAVLRPSIARFLSRSAPIVLKRRFIASTCPLRVGGCNRLTMSGKQATLKYVKPAQQTIGKFFGQPNGRKAPAQQSKLAFSSKTGPKPSKADEDEENHETKISGGSEDKSMKDADVRARQKPPKRSLEEDDGNEASSADEPPVKKTRSKPLESVGKVKVEEDEEDAEKNTKPKSRLKRSDKAFTSLKRSLGVKQEVEAEESKVSEKKPKVSKKRVFEDDDEAVQDEQAERAPISTRLPQTRSIENDNSSEQDNTESENDEEDSDIDEEKPEVAAKAREKMQSTLQNTGKDPYPDWKPGEPVPYAALCTTFSKIEMTTKRLEILAHCSLFLRQVLRLTPDDLLPTILLMTNKLAADYAGIELGIGESLIMKAIGESTGRSLNIIKADQNEIGDLGLVAAKSRSNQPTMFKPKPLTVRGVHKGLIEIATIEGQGAQGRKIAGIKKLLSAADADKAGKGGKGVDITKDKGGPSEAKFIVRTLEGKLRLGLAERTVLVALAQACVFHEVSQKGNKLTSTEQLAKGESILKSVYNELPSYEAIIPSVLEHGLFNLRENCKLQPGVPLKPMLAKPTKSITEVLDRFDNKDFTCEYKYDGERAQIHFVAHDSPQQYATTVPQVGKTQRGIANIFSRNSEDLSKKYPDILIKLPTWVKEDTKSFVLDCETVAWDVVEKKVLPFQQLMTRKRKDVDVKDIKVKVCVFAFDLLFLNGEALVNKPFRERREKLHASFSPVEGEFAFATYGNTNELEQIQHLLEESVKASCEGLMVKMLDGVESHYEPSRRSQNWLKVKKDYLAGVGDSLDLVVLGAYYGRGKRTSWYGAFLLACYNPHTQNFETVCNIGTGFSEEILAHFHEKLSEIVIDKPKPFYKHSAGNKDQPDVWFEPRYVWEVKTADLTLSPRYKAAASEVSGGGKGISLRFPRFIKERDDKKPDQATTSRAVAEMYRKQEAVTKSKGPSVDDDFEY